MEGCHVIQISSFLMLVLASSAHNLQQLTFEDDANNIAARDLVPSAFDKIGTGYSSEDVMFNEIPLATSSVNDEDDYSVGDEWNEMPLRRTYKARGLRKFSNGLSRKSYVQSYDDVLPYRSEGKRNMVALQWGLLKRIGRKFRHALRAVKRSARRVSHKIKHFGKRTMHKTWQFVKSKGRAILKHVKKFGKKAFRVLKKIQKAVSKGMRTIGKSLQKFSRSLIRKMVLQRALEMLGVPPTVGGPILELLSGENPGNIRTGRIPGGEYLKGLMNHRMKNSPVFRKFTRFIKGGGLQKTIRHIFRKSGLHKSTSSLIKHRIEKVTKGGGLKRTIKKYLPKEVRGILSKHKHVLKHVERKLLRGIRKEVPHEGNNPTANQKHREEQQHEEEGKQQLTKEHVEGIKHRQNERHEEEAKQRLVKQHERARKRKLEEEHEEEREGKERLQRKHEEENMHRLAKQREEEKKRILEREHRERKEQRLAENHERRQNSTMKSRVNMSLSRVKKGESKL